MANSLVISRALASVLLSYAPRKAYHALSALAAYSVFRDARPPLPTRAEASSSHLYKLHPAQHHHVSLASITCGPLAK